MKASAITPGLVFAIDVLLANNEPEAAETIQRTCGISLTDPADRAVVQAMKADGSIFPRTIAFLKKAGKKPNRSGSPPSPRITRYENRRANAESSHAGPVTPGLV